MDRATRISAAFNSLTLFATASTLVCCAVPILLVALGFGAVVAATTNSMPVLVTLSANKEYLFAGSGLLLGLSFSLVYRANRVCPDDPVLADYCKRTQRWNRRVLWSSAIIWVIGFFAAYLALPLRLALGI